MPLSVKQHMRINKIIDLCHAQITRQGAHARIVLRIPGTLAHTKRRRLSAKGPYGQIVTATHDGKKLLVMFRAESLITSLEEIRYAHFTGRPGN